MAKRNPNDRNEKAIQARKDKDAKTVFETKDGRSIQLRAIDLVFINMVNRSVDMPEKPTYQTKTPRGRTEEFPLDAVVVKQYPEYKPLWTKYLTEYAEAQMEQTDRVIRATLLDGTIKPEEWHDKAWERRMKFLRYELPDDLDELWVVYLLTTIGQDELADLMSAIYRLSGISDEEIQEAEDSFRDSVRTGQGQAGDVAESESDQGEATGEQVES